MEKQYFLLNVHGPISDKANSYHVELINLISITESNIEKINFDRIGNILTGYILISGAWNQIALLKSNIEKFKQNFNASLEVVELKIL